MKGRIYRRSSAALQCGELVIDSEMADGNEIVTESDDRGGAQKGGENRAGRRIRGDKMWSLTCHIPNSQCSHQDSRRGSTA